MTNDIQFPILMTRRSCWEPERFADSATAYNQNEYDSLKSKGFIAKTIPGGKSLKYIVKEVKYDKR